MKWMLAAALLLAALPAAHAELTDNLDFAESSYLRIAAGDIPRTTAVEPAGQWNAVEYQRVRHLGGDGWSPGLFVLPAGAAFDGAACTCGNVTVDRLPGGQFQVNYSPTVPAGEYVIAFRFHATLADFAFNVESPTGAATAVNLYLVGDYTVLSNLSPSVRDLPSSAENPGYRIWQFHTAPNQADWFVLTTQAAAPAAPATNWLFVGAAFLAGIVVWAVLVSRGLVQAKSRRQVAAVAAHVEAAASEPAPVLEGKKRALLAALKEVELARQANEMPVEVYDAVKADLKKQAVTVMRALESGEKA